MRSQLELSIALTHASSGTHQLVGSPASERSTKAIRGQPAMSLDVEGFANADGTPVSLYWANHTSNQQWLVQGQGDGTFKIYAYSGQNSLQMLDDHGGSIANGTPVTTWEDNNTPAQRWIFLPVGGGYWRIVPENGAGTNQTLDIQNGSTAGIGSRADIYTYGGGNNQVFRLEDAGAPAILPSPKKGLAGYPNEIGNIHPSWIYTWGGNEPTGTPSNVEFVPMAWGYYGNANNGFVNWLNGVKSQPGVHNLLGFNEPDSSTQSNLSVAAALDGWQYLSAAGLPLATGRDLDGPVGPRRRLGPWLLASLLAIALAVVADIAIAALQRLLTPWSAAVPQKAIALNFSSPHPTIAFATRLRSQGHANERGSAWVIRGESLPAIARTSSSGV